MFALELGRPVAYHDLLPSEVKVTSQAKAVSTKTELVTFLKELREPAPAHPGKKGDKNQVRARFSDRQREEISEGIERALELIQPIEDAVLSWQRTHECVRQRFSK